jgi:hypothetical protein
MTRFIERFARGFSVVAVKFDFQKFSDMHGFDVLVAHVFESFQNGESLRIHDRFFWSDDDFSFHARKKILRKNPRAREQFLELKKICAATGSKRHKNIFAGVVFRVKASLNFSTRSFIVSA